jgi:hypothetical protein
MRGVRCQSSNRFAQVSALLQAQLRYDEHFMQGSRGPRRYLRSA